MLGALPDKNNRSGSKNRVASLYRNHSLARQPQRLDCLHCLPHDRPGIHSASAVLHWLPAGHARASDGPLSAAAPRFRGNIYFVLVKNPPAGGFRKSAFFPGSNEQRTGAGEDRCRCRSGITGALSCPGRDSFGAFLGEGIEYSARRRAYQRYRAVPTWLGRSSGSRCTR